jgi:hypothetical protein
MMFVASVGLLTCSIGLGLVLTRATLNVVFRLALHARTFFPPSA